MTRGGHSTSHGPRKATRSFRLCDGHDGSQNKHILWLEIASHALPAVWNALGCALPTICNAQAERAQLLWQLIGGTISVEASMSIWGGSVVDIVTRAGSTGKEAALCVGAGAGAGADGPEGLPSAA